MSSNRSTHTPFTRVWPFFASEYKPATRVNAGDVKPEFRIPKEPEKMVLRPCDAAFIRRMTESFKTSVAQKSAEVELLRAAKERALADLQAHPHLGLGEYGGPEHAVALEIYAAASKTYRKGKKRLAVLTSLLDGKYDMREYVVKEESDRKPEFECKQEFECKHEGVRIHGHGFQK